MIIDYSTAYHSIDKCFKQSRIQNAEFTRVRRRSSTTSRRFVTRVDDDTDYADDLTTRQAGITTAVAIRKRSQFSQSSIGWMSGSACVRCAGGGELLTLLVSDVHLAGPVDEQPVASLTGRRAQINRTVNSDNICNCT